MMIDLCVNKPPEQTRVVVAMSGGVDSSLVAGLLTRAGYEVIGITLQLYAQDGGPRRSGACCAGADIRDARQVAAHLGIPHYVLNYEDRFRQSVIDDFADSYARGETPIPCVRCNQTVKFSDLLATARDLKADALATGHYARRCAGRLGPELHTASDGAKDQSYFLFATTRDQLDFLCFPLGSQTKATTRAQAQRLGLPVSSKPDSQDICFVPDGRYADLVTRLRPEAAEPGDIVDMDGHILGRHDGIIHFTTGQRKRLGVGSLTDHTPLYVIRLEPESRRVVVGPRAATLTRHLKLHGINWLADKLDRDLNDVHVKLRSTGQPVPARIHPSGEGDVDVMDVTLETPQPRIAPGQACVFYRRTRVLGGGWVTPESRPLAGNGGGEHML